MKAKEGAKRSTSMRHNNGTPSSVRSGSASATNPPAKRESGASHTLGVNSIANSSESIPLPATSPSLPWWRRLPSISGRISSGVLAGILQVILLVMFYSLAKSSAPDIVASSPFKRSQLYRPAEPEVTTKTIEFMRNPIPIEDTPVWKRKIGWWLRRKYGISLPAGNEPAFLLFAQTHGSVSNQLVSFCNAAIQAIRHDLVLVLPPAFTPGGTGALRDRRGRFIYFVGTFFDLEYLEKMTGLKTIFMGDFLAIPDGKRATFDHRNRSHVPELLPFFIGHIDEEIDMKKMFWREADWRFNVQPISFSQALLDPGQTLNGCMRLKRSDYVMRNCKLLSPAMSCRLVLLDSLFTNLLDCSHVDTNFDAIRRYVVPVKEIQETVKEFLASYEPNPVIAVHCRYVGNEDNEATFKDKMTQELSRGIELLRKRANNPNLNPVVHVIGIRTPTVMFSVQQMIKHFMTALNLDASRFTNIDRDLPNVQLQADRKPAIVSHWAKEMDGVRFNALFSSEYSIITVDQYICVQSAMYVGRNASTFSMFVKSWRALDGKETIMV